MHLFPRKPEERPPIPYRPPTTRAGSCGCPFIWLWTSEGSQKKFHMTKDTYSMTTERAVVPPLPQQTRLQYQAQSHSDELDARDALISSLHEEIQDAAHCHAEREAETGARLAAAAAAHEAEEAALKAQLASALSQLAGAQGTSRALQARALESSAAAEALRSRLESADAAMQAQERASAARLSSAQALLEEELRDAAVRQREAVVLAESFSRERAELQQRCASAEHELEHSQRQCAALLRDQASLAARLDSAQLHERALSREGIESARHAAQQFESQLMQNQRLLRAVQGQRSDLQRQVTELRLERQRQDAGGRAVFSSPAQLTGAGNPYSSPLRVPSSLDDEDDVDADNFSPSSPFGALSPG